MNPNPQQQLVVDHLDGPCLVTAVPGSGKTASVTERTKKMVSLGVEPSSILAITFTNKAAEEMRSRIGQAVGAEKAAKMTISTFHSLCARILRSNANLAGLTKEYTIYDEDDAERLLKNCAAKIEEKPDDPEPYKPSDHYLKVVRSHIEGSRNAMLDHAHASARFPLSFNQHKAVTEYYRALRAANAIDFTGLLDEVVKMFDKHPEVLEYYRSKWKYISVDEVQDTNLAQYKMIKQLGLGHKNVLVVGDLDQSVYRFRNASPENILAFEKDFGAKVLKLEKNYRSTPEILRHAQNLIERNKLRKSTILATDNQSNGDLPRIIGAPTDFEMAQMIAQDVESALKRGVSPREIAVLYRTNFASKVLEDAMRERHIKYRIVGGQSFWKRKEIKGAICILKLLCNPGDRIAFQKTVEFCCRGVGPKSLSVITDHANDGQVQVMQSAKQFLKLNTSQSRALAPLVDGLEAASTMPPHQALISVAKGTAFWARMADDSTDRNDRCANVQEMAYDLERAQAKGWTLAEYLQNISLLSDADEQGDEEQEVRLMTLHGCKGLEFDRVYISHVISEMLPHSRVMEVQDLAERAQQIEEERRLLYVGMTRARKCLRLCFCRQRMGKDASPSPFLSETRLQIPMVPVPPRKQRG